MADNPERHDNRLGDKSYPKDPRGRLPHPEFGVIRGLDGRIAGGEIDEEADRSNEAEYR
jgi:hypothetical protein